MPYAATDLPFLIALPILLIASAFFSGSETALFGLSAHQRLKLTTGESAVARALSALLDDQRTLLVTLMLGNMTVNVLYFVVSSALLLKLDPHEVNPAWIAVMTVAPLVMIILAGEVMPKMVANVARVGWVRVTVVPLVVIHRAAKPIGFVVGHGIIQPLGRLLAPSQSAEALSGDELHVLLETSERRGVIGFDEQRMLREVLKLSEMKVRDVVVPRVDIIAIDVHASPVKLRELFQETGLSKVVAYDGDLDHVLGVVYARQFLLASRLRPNVRIANLVRNVRFVPELQRVDQLLEDFRRTATKVVIAVDEYGGTVGLVTVKDVVERLVGDLDMDEAPGESPESHAEEVRPGVFRVHGRLSVHDWDQTFAAESIPPRVSTVAGLIMALLGRVPNEGDTVRIANLEMQIERMDGGRIDSVLLHLVGDGDLAAAVNAMDDEAAEQAAEDRS
ncbi:MAG: DUF21 domain-containing protein [Phycisphaera sp.]|nr:DUF21 domain-containing protein [Phycisphaera sp.]